MPGWAPRPFFFSVELGSFFPPPTACSTLDRLAFIPWWLQPRASAGHCETAKTSRPAWQVPLSPKSTRVTRLRFCGLDKIEHYGCCCLHKRQCRRIHTTPWYGVAKPPAWSHTNSRTYLTSCDRLGAQETLQPTRSHQPLRTKVLGARRVSSAVGARETESLAAPTARTGPARSWTRRAR